jgi:hypothetical protein
MLHAPYASPRLFFLSRICSAIDLPPPAPALLALIDSDVLGPLRLPSEDIIIPPLELLNFELAPCRHKLMSERKSAPPARRVSNDSKGQNLFLKLVENSPVARQLMSAIVLHAHRAVESNLAAAQLVLEPRYLLPELSIAAAVVALLPLRAVRCAPWSAL